MRIGRGVATRKDNGGNYGYLKTENKSVECYFMEPISPSRGWYDNDRLFWL